ncbi:MAG: tetratricopeptide repeat protein [Chitinophagaceae bacterium]
MKKIIIALLPVLVGAQILYGQDCKTQAENKLSTSIRAGDYILQSGEGPKPTITTSMVKPQLSIAENWVKGILKDFTGAKMYYQNNYSFDLSKGSLNGKFYNATGIAGTCYFKTAFFAYYCNDNNNKIFAESESGSFLHVYFNNVVVDRLCTTVGVITVNGKSAFELLEKTRTEGRIDYYDRIAMANVNDTIFRSKSEYIIIRNSDLPVFLPITRKEYLGQLLKDVEDYKSREAVAAKADYNPANEAANKARLDEELKRIDNSKSYTKEQMAPYRKRFIETWETEKQKFDKRMNQIETETSSARETLLEYMKKPQEWLSRSFKLFFGYSIYTGKAMKEYLDGLDEFSSSREEETRTYVAYINPAYYNKSLRADIPQSIMVTLDKGSYPHMKKVAERVHRRGALAPLEAILSPGRSLITQQPPAVASSAYSLSYLPKLNKLSTLMVPAGMKLSSVPSSTGNTVSVTKLNFATPSLSPKLKQLPSQPLTQEGYKNYMLGLQAKISSAIQPENKKKADNYIKNKALSNSKDIAGAALGAWVQHTPQSSLYLFGKAAVADLPDALIANNFAAFLMMAGLPEKSIPILDFWNRQKPGETTLLSNLGNAYYRLGDINKAMKYLQECVQKDSLHPTANKLLCIMYLEKGDVKKAEEHGSKSIATCHDEEVIAILHQLNNKIKPGELMTRYPALPAKEFPMLKRTLLTAMPSNLDDMEQFEIELNAQIASLKMTIDNIEANSPTLGDDIADELLRKDFGKNLSPVRMKAQYIIIDGMQIYNTNKKDESDVFDYTLKMLNGHFNANIKAIQKKYAVQLNKLEGGEAGDEDQIAALELAKCKEINKEKQAYLTNLSIAVNQYAQRQECISRKFFRDYANWAPYWVPQTMQTFPSIEVSYLKDVLNILQSYHIINKEQCSQYEPLPVKPGKLQKWEDEYCANFKGKIDFEVIQTSWTCNSWGIEGGEGALFGLEVNYSDRGEFEDFTLEAGVGAKWDLGEHHFVEVGAEASVKEFIKIGVNKSTGDFEIKDFGLKGEVTLEGGIGSLSGEIKIIEVSAAVNAGVQTGGIATKLLPLD